VLEVDAVANRVVVGPGELLARGGLIADRISWVAGEPPAEGPFEAEVQVRYRGEDVPSVLEIDGDHLRIMFRAPQRGIAPGQSVVVYRGEELLGGGRILESIR
jgi:tRNA-specific 2-thiouridylase